MMIDDESIINTDCEFAIRITTMFEQEHVLVVGVLFVVGCRRSSIIVSCLMQALAARRPSAVVSKTPQIRHYG
jgi:hypothetical protein